ncbi:MAG TPA: CYTH domain-containing protein [Steroidobacteraceae bacterium]|jgi:adenylate cyclase
MAVEIERKFRVSGDAWRAQARSRRLLRQGYLANTARASVRVRLDDGEGWLSVKSMRGGMTRDEYEVEIARTDAQEMLERLCEGFAIEKWRHLVDYAGHTWEVDEFLAENAGLIIAELELPAEDTPFERPPWLGAEITDEERFYNVRLSQKPFRHWPENLLASR